MFCPSCGSELIEPNQSFCSKCGSEIGAPLETHQLRTERPRQESTNTLQSPPESTSVKIYQQKPMIKEGQPGPYSKKCLVFALASNALAISGLVISTGSLIFSMIRWFGFAQNSSGFLLRLILVIVLNIIGLLFAIESRSDSKKVGELEPVNTVEKIGSIFAIIGIIVNTISIALALIIAPIPFYFSSSFPKRFL